MSTYQLLQLIPECRETGRGLDELLEEIGADVAWVRRNFRHCTVKISRWYFRRGYDEDDNETDYGEETIAEFRARCGEEYRRQQATNWLGWCDPVPLLTLASIYKKRYSDEHVYEVVTRDHPAFGAMTHVSVQNQQAYYLPVKLGPGDEE